MGCDIHMHYELKTDTGWSPIDWKEPHRTGKYDDGSEKLDWGTYFKDPLYVGRNYDLFAILANVRNGVGFAGIPTGTGFNPIAMPRGLPDDVSPAVKAESDKWGVDGHGHQWLTLAEAMDYNYEQQTGQLAVVTETEFGEFLDTGRPKSWCADVSGNSVVMLSNQEMKQLIGGNLERRKGAHYYTRIRWGETYRSAIGEHWFVLMNTLAERHGKENVRLVFWFDN